MNSTLTTNHCTKRICAEEVANVLKCILGTYPDAPPFPLQIVSGLQGRIGDEWCECQASNYSISFFVRLKAVSGVHRCVTPLGSGWDVDLDGGVPFLHLSTEEQQALSEMLLPDKPPTKAELKSQEDARLESLKDRSRVPFASKKKTSKAPRK